MIVRIAAVVAVLATFVTLGTPWNGSSSFLPTIASAAPAESYTNGLQFSSSVDSNGEAENPRIEFDKNTHTVWVSFELHDHDRNAKVSVGIRANGEDYDDFKLDCCDSSNGRFAFPIRKRNGHGELPGAAYDVRLYVNDQEIAQGGFGVKGRGGLDHDNDND